MRRPGRIVAPAIILLVSACNFPRDAEGTLDRVKNGVVRVGVANNPPWVVALDSTTGSETQLVGRLAQSLNAKPQLVTGSESRLLESLHDRKLDIVIGGFTDDSPWKGKVAFTKPYQEDAEGKKHVLALPPGENAWLVRVEKYLHENEAERSGGKE